jgi:hypothetical protein
MSVARYANRGSIAKNILVCIAFLFYLSGCAEGGAGSGNSNDFGRSTESNNSNNIVGGIVIDSGDEWLYRKGTSSPPSDWISVGFDDSAWLAGNTGIGYGDFDDSTVLSDMQGNYSTVYTRKVLNYDGSITITSLSLEIDYDDGFVAYINGQEVARANMPAGQPSFNTLASGDREAGTADIINLDGFINLIGIGNNVLAIEIHNASLTSSDLSFMPRLLVNTGALPLPTVSLSANPVNVVANGSTTLNWNSTDATGCTASGDWSGSKASSGSQTINALTANSNFNLSCSGPGGSASDSVSVTVSAPSAPLVNLTASPTNLPFNGSTTLSWTSSNTTGCTASGDWTGSKAVSGSQSINSLTANSNFSLSCSGVGGSASDSVSVTVAAPSAPSVNLTASPPNLPYNGSTTLSWTSSNTTGCTASGDWTGSKAVSGSQTMSALTSNSSYSLTCSGVGGSANDSVSVTVAAPVPTLSFSANPVTVSQNGSTTLNWNSTDATNCTASGDWSGNKGVSGSETINSLMIDRVFTLTCSGAGGSVNSTVNVTVVLSNNGTALLSWTPPTENTDGSPLTDLAGYKIRYGNSPGSYSDTVTINNPGLTSYLIENLPSSDWYFVMTSFNSSGIESSYSTEVSKTIN